MLNCMLKSHNNYSIIMGKNTGNKTRKGAVKDCSQVYNGKIDKYVKRDKKTGRFLSQKKTGGKYKGVKNEKK